MERRHMGRRGGWFGRGLNRLWAVLAAMRAEAELRAMDERELHDLGLDRGGIAYAARYGRPAQRGPAAAAGNGQCRTLQAGA